MQEIKRVGNTDGRAGGGGRGGAEEEQEEQEEQEGLGEHLIKKNVSSNRQRNTMREGTVIYVYAVEFQEAEEGGGPFTTIRNM